MSAVPNASLSETQKTIILRTFVEAADEDYICARWGAIHQLGNIFHWHAQQAAEKYIKAFLIARGVNVNSRKFGHDILKLIDRLNDEEPSVLQGTVSATLHLVTMKEPEARNISTKEAIEACVGVTDTRYNITNRYVDGRSLTYMDHWIFKLRRALVSQTTLGKQCTEQFQIDMFGEDVCIHPRDWVLRQTMPIEKLFTAALMAPQFDRPLSQDSKILLTDNVEIWTGEPLIERWSGSSFLGSPLFACFAEMRYDLMCEQRNAQCDNSRAKDAEVLEWTLDNIPMTRQSVEQLKKEFNRVKSEHRDRFGP